MPPHAPPNLASPRSPRPPMSKEPPRGWAAAPVSALLTCYRLLPQPRGAPEEAIWLDSHDTALVAIDTQNLEQVLLRVQVIRIALDELADDRDGVEFQQFHDEAAWELGIIVVHQR